MRGEARRLAFGLLTLLGLRKRGFFIPYRYADQVPDGARRPSYRALGRFDPKRYRSWVAKNSDFRKYDDALRMTIDCTRETAARLEEFLAEAEAARIIEFGLHRQGAALMTCIVPSYVSNDHVHFLDGAGGGYALAAQALKDKLAARTAEAGLLA